ncbi:MAG TPA: cobyric acid synthase, partial [Acidimicrobiales bacterium]
MNGTILVTGTTSGSGKSTLVAGLCRWGARRGLSVAPFKAQNMSLNSFVTRQGDEIGRAQASQAQAARIEPEARMNPVLLKPGTDSRSQLVVLGRPAGEIEARAYWHEKASLLDVVVESYRDLRERFDVVICEGAGSPAEINLRAVDIVNLGFARAVGAPVIVVSDIDRGGMFASLVGTLALLDDEDQRLVQGFVVNRFRGDQTLLEPGLTMLETLTGRPTLGVLPYVEGLWVDEEDRPDPSAFRDPGQPIGEDTLRVAVLRLPRSSNLTDLDPLAAEPGVILVFASYPQEIADADLVVVPGTRATVDDLAWMRRRGFDAALAARAAA